MAENIVLAPVATFTNDSSAVATTNANNILIQNAFANVHDRYGTAPNQMQSVLDMNGFNIINLPSPATINSPVRLVDVVTPSIALTVPPIGTSGSVVGLLNGNKTDSGNNTFTGINTFSKFKAPGVGTTLEVFGGVSDGVTDNTSALAALLTAYSGLNIVVNLSAGTYYFASPQTIALVSNASLTFMGQGQDISVIQFPANGFIINFTDSSNSVHFRNLSIITNSHSGTTAIGVTVTMTGTPGTFLPYAQSDFTNVTFRGSGSGYNITNYWYICVQLNKVSYFSFVNCDFDGPYSGGAYSTNGIGVFIQGTVVIVPAVFNFTSCSFNLLQNGIYYGPYTQGVNVSQCNFTGGSYGIYTPPSVNNLDQLTVVGCQFNNSIAGILTQTEVPNTMISSNFFIIPTGAAGIYLSANDLFSIVGNTFNSVSLGTNQGIIIGTWGGAPGVIMGNAIFDLATGIYLMASSQFVNVQSNVYQSNTNNIVNSGTNNTLGGGST